MGQADLEINRRTRSVFVRHWIDLGHLSLRSINGRVTVRGNLTRVFGEKEELTPAIVDAIFREIRRIPGVRGTTIALENWSNDTGSWISKEKGAPARPQIKPKTNQGDGSPETYVID